jgi:phosphoribosyl 1,2-cyclic phosphodiesterase
VKVTFWGTRGSLPSPRPGTTRYGGNTSCVSLRLADGSGVVLDAGTGIHRLADFGPDTTRVDVLLTHLHMDHIVGLGFFAPLYRPDLEVHMWGPPSTTETLHERLTRYLSPPLFPVRLRDMPCRLELHDAPRGRFELPGVSVLADRICHPGLTVGYRLEADGASLAYLPDHEPALGVPPGRFPREPEWTSGFALMAGADLAIHDAQFTDEEYESRQGWGHCTLSHALALASAAGVRHLVPFHHDPDHDDDLLDEIYAKAMTSAAVAGGALRLTPGVEGAEFLLSGPAVTAASAR